ncbi:L-type lectin-domain containing receptor kinase IX.1-like [Canna indica]|uniref:L-type lectin-domain containing receptor kinase IX.1-like n=1 Tax=Canna indica TaxID=4628 RepID=A0AAQ3L1H5_9LILI|nr:L-type lectin-domain containing receptor kinase IX.1-like [Canna indica]
MILTAVFFLSMLIPMASSLSFNISSFDQEAMLKINLEGDALGDEAVANDTTLMLTKDGANLGGSARATYSDPLLLWDAKTGELTDFTTEFSFTINSSQENHADGLAFFLTKFGSSMPVFSKGGYLGLFSNSTSVNSTSDSTVAVEFDTFSNHEKDIGDPIGEHLGIDINSIRSSANVSWNSSTREGKVANARVDYNSSTYNLSVFVTYAKTNLSPAANYSLHYIVDLRKVLPEIVSVGFSAAVGNYTETHSILSWSFSSTLKPKDKSNVGLAAGLAVGATLMLALCFLCFILYRKKKKKLGYLDNMDCDEAIDHEFESERGPKRRMIMEAADEKLNGNFDERQMESLMVVGLWCAHPDYSVRPSIKQVISTLSFEIPLPMLPPVRPVPIYYTPSFHMFSVATPSMTETTPSGQFAHSFELPLSPHSLIDHST